MNWDNPGDFATVIDRASREFGRDNTQALAECAELARANFENNFDLGQEASGVPWAPHAPLTVKLYGPHPLLILSGKMKAATIEQGAAGHVERVSSDALDIGLSTEEIPYAPTHQFGGLSSGEHGVHEVPRREFIAVSDDTVQRMADAIGREALASLF